MATLPVEGTLLLLSTTGIPLYSARGLVQTLTPIEQSANLRRDINGNLVNLSLQQFQKYASKITCKDVNAPALDGIWPGQIISVSCVSELSFLTASGIPARPAVDGSMRFQGAFTFYRPLLNMMVMQLNLSEDEWPADYAWELSLEEQ
jgi:hypothetical protein